MKRALCLIFITLVLIYLNSCAGVPVPGSLSSSDSDPVGDSGLPEEKRADTMDSGEVTTAKSESESIEPAAAGREEKGRSKDISSDSELSKSALSTTGTPGRLRSTPSTSGLKAGYADDNKQFNYFINFLNNYGDQVDHLPLKVEERIILRVQDKAGKSLPNCQITVFDRKRILCSGKTMADGTFLFFPSEYEGNISQYRAVIRYNKISRELGLNRFGKREIEVPFDLLREEQKNIPLDILFILDTTGSMGEEIERLKTTIEIINLNLSSLSSKPGLRFGMVLYKDMEDEYVTRIIPLTGSLDKFRKALNEVAASGGGDTPEDLQTALKDAMQKVDWNRNGIRLSFIITDAPPHLDYGQDYTYVQAAVDAKKQGIKIFSVGTGGLDLMGEYILRQISQYTSSRFIFLTYGEQWESEGGEPGSVSHHTGANYQTDKLEAIIIRFTKEELKYVTDQPIEEEEDYFKAVKLSDEGREETLKKLFEMAISQLIDYSTFRISEGTPASVLPISPAVDTLAGTAEYFTEQLIFSFSRNKEFQKTFRILEREDLQHILEELELQLTGLGEESQAARVGALLGAEILIIGKLYRIKDAYELFLKLLRVETGEVLGVTKALLDTELGL